MLSRPPSNVDVFWIRVSPSVTLRSWGENSGLFAWYLFKRRLIALRLGKPPAGYGHWTLRLLADQLAELEMVDSISPETVRQTLKKTA
ncbi:MAG: helix-turn-helix domain-containing protein [Planctomycetaceae bacterium]|nr:helix-turn-helix domain-containing protein [Planctomycetaceae bacterium]